MLSNKAVLTNPYEGWPDLSFNGTIEATDEGFSWKKAGQETTFTRGDLPGVLQSFPADLWLNIVLARVLPRVPAIAEADRIASTIAQWFNTLLPIYQNQPPPRMRNSLQV